jgi:hypothetical protein
MDWMEWIGRRVFVRTKKGRVYSGIVEDVDEDSKPLIFIKIKDKFDNDVLLVHSEIVEVKEEEDGQI